jgi:hypothetical protein
VEPICWRRFFPRARVLSHYSADPTHQTPSLTSCPLPPAHLRPQPSTLALSLALRVHPGSSAAAHRSLSSVLRPPSSPRHARCLGEFRLAVSNSVHPSVHPQPLWSARSVLTGVFPCNRSSATIDTGRPCISVIALGLQCFLSR